jgi:hypothetical protein
MNHILYKDGILKAKPFKRLPWLSEGKILQECLQQHVVTAQAAAYVNRHGVVSLSVENFP